MASGRTGGISALLLALALVLGVPSACAATRHASPGASGPEPCANAAPCSLFTAVSGAANGDEVIVAPGEYTDTAGDLGAPAVKDIQIPLNVVVRGEADKPRPRILLEEGKWLGGVFEVNSEDLVAHLEITTAVASGDIVQFGGTIEDLIIRNTASSLGFACSLTRGTMRDTVCLAGGAEMAALGGSISGAGTLTATLRNVTAIADGVDGVGLYYAMSDGGTITVDAKSVIAKGDTKDVVAEGLSTSGTPGTGGHVTINLDHSVYGASEQGSEAGGTAAIVGTNSFNVAPLLAADGYHQLKGSPTIDMGATDVASGSTDIDGQNRTIDGQADIGADEYAHPTSLTLSCTPAEVILTDAVPGGGTTCRATVTDEAEKPLAFAGSVSFSSNGAGSFEAHSCQLPTSPEPSVTCQVNYLPRIGGAGSHTITAAFAGDAEHEGSQATASVQVTEMLLGPCPASSSSCGGGSRRKALSVTIVRKPAKKSTSGVAKLTFTSSEQASFECKLDKQKFKPCHSPYKHKVKPGQHSFAVRAVGAAGLTSSPATYGWRVLRPARR